MRRSDDLLDDSQNPVETLAWEAFELGCRYAAEEVALRQYFLSRLKELASTVRQRTDLDNPGTIMFTASSRSPVDLASWRSRAAPGSSLPANVLANFGSQTEAIIHDDARASRPWHGFKSEFLRDRPGLTPKTIWSYNQASTI